MPRALAYHRPSTLDEAVSLLAVPGRVVLGGGTIVMPESVTLKRSASALR